MGRGVPVVGMTTYRQRAAWGPWDRDAAVLAAAYVDAVAGAGGCPVLLPPAPGPGDGAASAGAVVEALDALVLVGGGDVHPDRYGRPPHEATDGCDPVRDHAELVLLDAALAADLPVLAVCRGLQLLDVHLGGTLLQHVPDALGHHGHRPARGGFADVEVHTTAGSALAAILGTRASVRCSHHQAVETVGRGLVVSARSADGLVEGVELPGARFVLGVQWHPEEGEDGRLFAALVAAAR